MAHDTSVYLRPLLRQSVHPFKSLFGWAVFLSIITFATGPMAAQVPCVAEPNAAACILATGATIDGNATISTSGLYHTVTIFGTHMGGVITQGDHSTLFNSGLINLEAGTSGNNSALINTGRINGNVLSLGSNSPIINSGFMGGGVTMGGDNPVLTLLPGSEIIGTISLTASDSIKKGTQTLNVMPGLSVDLSILSGTPDVIHTFGAPVVTDNGHVVVVNPTGFRNADINARDLTSYILTGIAPPIETVFKQGDTPAPEDAASPHYRAWASGIAGRSHTTGSDAIGDLNHRTLGIMAGFDVSAQVGRIGLFGGAAESEFSGNHQVGGNDVESVFGGAYWRGDYHTHSFQVGLIAGLSDHAVSRQASRNQIISNNEASPGSGGTGPIGTPKGAPVQPITIPIAEPGDGLEHGRSSFDGWFVMPSATLTVPIVEAPVPVVGSIRASYSGFFLDGYTEQGLTNPLMVDARELHLLGLRAELKLPKTFVGSNSGSVTRTRLSFGVEGSYQVGSSNISATLIGQSLTFDASSEDQLFAFAGVGLVYIAPGDQFRFSASGEAQADFNSNFRLSGMLKLSRHF